MHGGLAALRNDRAWKIVVIEPDELTGFLLPTLNHRRSRTSPRISFDCVVYLPFRCRSSEGSRAETDGRRSFGTPVVKGQRHTGRRRSSSANMRFSSRLQGVDVRTSAVFVGTMRTFLCFSPPYIFSPTVRYETRCMTLCHSPQARALCDLSVSQAAFFLSFVSPFIPTRHLHDRNADRVI